MVIKRLFRSQVVQNALALYGVQLFGFLIPLLVLPYVARILEPSTFGILASAQAFATWLGVLVEYGFSFSATREITGLRDHKSEMARLVSAVVSARLLLCFIAAFVVIAIGFWAPLFRESPWYLLGSWLFALGQGLSPSWYFQGLERMRTPAVFEVIARLVGMLMVFFTVRAPADGWKVLLVQALPMLLLVIFLHLIIHRETAFGFSNISDTLRVLRDGWGMFVYRALVSLYTSANSFLLGLFVNSTQVAYYGGAERILNFVTAPLWPMWRAVYPRTSYLVRTDYIAAKTWMRRLFWLFFIAGLVLAAGLWLFSPLLVQVFLGPGYESSSKILRILALAIPSIVVGGVLGLQWLVPLGLERWLNAATLGAGVINLGLYLFLVPRFGSLGMAYSVVIAELIVAILTAAALQRLGKGFWR